MPQKLKNFVNGKPSESQTQRWGDVYNPALGSVASLVPMSTAADVDAAVSAAKKAYVGWSATPAVRRARVLFRFKALIDEHMTEVATLLTSEPGKGRAHAGGSGTPRLA